MRYAIVLLLIIAAMPSMAADVVQQPQDRGAGREVGCRAVVDLFQHPR